MGFSIFDLFKKSPFEPIQEQMKKIKECVYKIPTLVEHLKEGDFKKYDEDAKIISHLEHEVDLLKNRIRDNLPKSIFLPVPRDTLLNILSSQDAIADCAEDFAVLVTLRPMKLPEELHEPFDEFLTLVLKTFDKIFEVVMTLDDLLETSFGGEVAKKVYDMINKVGEIEHEADIAQANLARELFKIEDNLKPMDVFMWLKIFNKLGDIANLSEKVGNRIRLFISK